MPDDQWKGGYLSLLPAQDAPVTACFSGPVRTVCAVWRGISAGASGPALLAAVRRAAGSWTPWPRPSSSVSSLKREPMRGNPGTFVTKVVEKDSSTPGQAGLTAPGGKLCPRTSDLPSHAPRGLERHTRPPDSVAVSPMRADRWEALQEPA